jgi:hypothetical protein
MQYLTAITQRKKVPVRLWALAKGNGRGRWPKATVLFLN